HSNILRRKTAAWIEVQTISMPKAAKERAKALLKASPDGTFITKAYEIPLFLPLTLQVSKIVVSEELQGSKWKLCKGKAYNALKDLQNFLRLCLHMYTHKCKNVQSVRDNTCVAIVIDTASEKINRAAEKYRAAHA
ncbi:hypothetical protein C0991_012290, partial [Blastosporella zonata]